MPEKAEDLIARLGLAPLPVEGGYFRRTYRSPSRVETPSGTRDLMTSIYYLITAACRCRLHRLRSDELYHFYAGDAVHMLQLFDGGEGKVVTLGPDTAQGQEPQLLVPAGVWQGSWLSGAGEFALMGTTVTPGFTWDDFEDADRANLLSGYKAFSDLIEKLT